jgi:hypothetical protein
LRSTSWGKEVWDAFHTAPKFPSQLYDGPRISMNYLKPFCDLFAEHLRDLHLPDGISRQTGEDTLVLAQNTLIGDPFASGIVASVARPGGNITGQSFFNPELRAKRKNPASAAVLRETTEDWGK